MQRERRHPQRGALTPFLKFITHFFKYFVIRFSSRALSSTWYALPPIVLRINDGCAANKGAQYVVLHTSLEVAG